MKATATALLLSILFASSAGASGSEEARRFRIGNERQILDELLRFLAIPNLASDTANIEKNAAAIVQMFGRRNIEARLLRVEGAPPIVVADVAAPGARTTVAFYAHYDGQPVDASQWTSPPWSPVIRPAGAVTPESRIYARSSSDDKSPIVAMLAALDALRAARITPSVNLKFVFEGEEEAGSPHLAEYLEKFKGDLSPDAWILCDGPVHQSRRPLVYFGARGVLSLALTVYGPARVLHSGHYGNWAANPIITLTHLIGSMRDREGRILVNGFYDNVKPLTAIERASVAATASFDDAIRRELALGRTEGSEPLNELILKPALNVSGIAAGNVGEKASNSIPTEARAAIDFRLVPDLTPERVRKLVESHLTKQGFFIVRGVPDAQTRLAHPNVARVEWGSGYPAARTAMDLPLAKRVVSLVASATKQPPVQLPSLGGSIPMYLFQRGGTIPAVGVPVVNHDNNQHAANENLRVQNFWDGIEIYAELFEGLGP
jgi:acetylornithine deacetylase/succinyl-diaminopimelate desuccinylase-like protein